MKQIWAPWRIKYLIQSAHKQKGCLFCRLHKQRRDKTNYIFLRKKHTFAILNTYPYNNGHSLILPYRHVKELGQLPKKEREELFDLLQEVQCLLDRVMKPAGYNIGINYGKVAGAGYPGHVHVHIVPRWNGDVNFMPVVNDTKVVSQSLKALYNQLIQFAKARKHL